MVLIYLVGPDSGHKLTSRSLELCTQWVVQEVQKYATPPDIMYSDHTLSDMVSRLKIRESVAITDNDAEIIKFKNTQAFRMGDYTLDGIYDGYEPHVWINIGGGFQCEKINKVLERDNRADAKYLSVPAPLIEYTTPYTAEELTQIASQHMP